MGFFKAFIVTETKTEKGKLEKIQTRLGTEEKFKKSIITVLRDKGKCKKCIEVW